MAQPDLEILSSSGTGIVSRIYSIPNLFEHI